IDASINEEPLYLHATGFILWPDGTIFLSVYSSGAIGRLVANDTIGLIRHYQ
ncbi:MAG: peroxiredoxin, partial [Nitrospinota bacterium]